MAHFAQLDENNVVLEVLVVNNSDIDNLPFPDSEPVGQAYLTGVFPSIPETSWAQTSYNGNFRVRYAGLGYTFYPNNTATAYGGFSPPKWCDNLVFDEALCEWVPPIPYPTDGKNYHWDCAQAAWVLDTIQPPTPTTVID
jgi:hypothetical protein